MVTGGGIERRKMRVEVAGYTKRAAWALRRGRGPGSGRLIVRLACSVYPPGVGPKNARNDGHSAFSSSSRKGKTWMAGTKPGHDGKRLIFQAVSGIVRMPLVRAWQLWAQFSTLIFASRMTRPHLSIS